MSESYKGRKTTCNKKSWETKDIVDEDEVKCGNSIFSRETTHRDEKILQSYRDHFEHQISCCHSYRKARIVHLVLRFILQTSSHGILDETLDAKCVAGEWKQRKSENRISTRGAKSQSHLYATHMCNALFTLFVV